MFAKRQPALAGAPTPPKASARPWAERLAGLARNPWLGAGSALALFAGAGAVLLLVAGDPRAGAPSVRAAVERPAAAAPEAPPTGLEAFTVDTLGLFQDLTAPGFELGEAPPIQGSAVIVLPEGAVETPVPAASGPSAAARRAQPLSPAPAAGLTQPSPFGPLPVIGSDGRTPFAAYQRPFKADGRPKVALIVGGLGLNAAATRAAIERLPPEVTLSFVPYAEGLQGWIDLARAYGHEVLLEIPMEPADYPDNDPGPQTLLAAGSAEENQRKLEWLLGRAQGYFGVTNYLGERFTASESGMAAFTGALRARGLAFVDDGSARRVRGAFARASADRIVDDQLAAEAILARLAALEAQAKEKGQALGSGFAYPVTVEAALRWAEGLDRRGVQLAPASAITRR